MIWMVFITVYYAKLIIKTLHAQNRLYKHGTKLSIRLCLLILHLLFSTSVIAFERGHNADSGYNDFILSAEVKEAVDNGIVLSFECKLKINKTLAFISWASQKETHVFSLTHNSLSNRYLVRVNGNERPKHFDSIGEATNFIIDQSTTFFRHYSSDKRDTQMRLTLNKFKLPGPIRLNAFIADYWNIDTGWISWALEI